MTRLALTSGRQTDICTYRLQLNAGFTFADVAAIADYLAALGISHVYLSPITEAVRGSNHGYDVTDPRAISTNLGGQAAYFQMNETLKAHGLNQMLDIVPNHMAIATPDNPWWRDVLENGNRSRYWSYFDWGWPASGEDAKVHIPVLEARYGEVVEAGKIRLIVDREGLKLLYGDFAFPVAVESYSMVIEPAARRAGHQDLQLLSALYASPESLSWLQSATLDPVSQQPHHEAAWSQVWRLYEADAAVRIAILQILDEINSEAGKLHALLDQQHYRLTYWRTVDEHSAYRRFFDINTLIGVRVEEDKVFQDRHELVASLLRDGHVDGLRVDHIDGLREPERYLQRLRQTAPAARIVVEKILGATEELPGGWPVEGTTGYDFLNKVNGLFVDPLGEEALSAIYSSFTGNQQPYPELLFAKKRLVLHQLFAADLHTLTDLLDQICDRHIESRDWSRSLLQEALTEFAVALPVYRTYVDPRRGEVAEADRDIVCNVVRSVSEQLGGDGPAILAFLEDLFLLRTRGELETELILRFQQLTGPLMAKGAEDTAFYCYNRLISLNEVGGDPDRFGVSLSEFHSYCDKLAEEWPGTMLATGTHDTKRGEDARLRIDVLSEVPDEWATALQRWSRANDHLRTKDLPDRESEYLLYQALIGAWPVNEERLKQYLIKSMREAKVHSSWRASDSEYERAIIDFASRALHNRQFTDDLAAMVRRIDGVAHVSSLAQTLIKLTAPGVPDIYQGSEFWDHSLVDPDNRRPIDFKARGEALLQTQEWDVEQAIDGLGSGLTKLWLIQRVLEARRQNREAFAQGYRTLNVSGNKREHAVAYMRGESIAVIAPRLFASLAGDWQDTRVELPHGSWQEVFSGELVAGSEGIELNQLLSRFPLALLVRRA